MKKLLVLLFLYVTIFTMPSVVFAQGTDGHTAREEAEGKEIWGKLQSKQLACKDLTDDNYGSLGEYFMGQTVGDSHEAMNTMMERMMGEQGEEQMHVVMGKRNSGCDTSFIPMMGSGFGTMMGGWGSFGVLGGLSMLVFWILLILGVVALIRYLARLGQDKESKTPLDILKERYARGEIEKKEFEEMKKDLI